MLLSSPIRGGCGEIFHGANFYINKYTYKCAEMY